MSITWIIILSLLGIIILVLSIALYIWYSTKRVIFRAEDFNGLVPEPIELNRYIGKWYEVARMDSWFESRDVHDVTAIYKPNADGTIQVINQGFTGSDRLKISRGRARLSNVDGALKVSFFPLIQAPYIVLGTIGEYGSSYTHAVVGSPNRKYLWFLSRQKHTSMRDREHLLQIARENGYSDSDLSRLHSTKQS